MKQLTTIFLILICVLFAGTIVNAQTNLLLNGQADSKTEHWRVVNTTVEEFDGDKVFVVRNVGRSVGHLQQYVEFTSETIGKYALFIGFVSSDRAIDDYKPTINFPHLYMAALGKSNAVSNGQIMRDNAKSENEWHTIYAILQVTKEDSDGFMKCFLYQRVEQNTENESSVMRFDNLGLYLFETEEDALNYAKTYK